MRMKAKSTSDGKVQWSTLPVMKEDRVRVEFCGDIADRPELEAEVTQLLAEAPDHDVVEAITRYADMRGVTASWFLGEQAMVVELRVPPARQVARSTRRAVGRDPLPRAMPVAR